MRLKGSHAISASSLRDLKNKLDALPDSVLDTAEIKSAELDVVEERTFHKDYTVNAWYLHIDLEWDVVER